MVGDGAGQESLTGPGRAVQQDALKIEREVLERDNRTKRVAAYYFTSSFIYDFLLTLT